MHDFEGPEAHVFRAVFTKPTLSLDTTYRLGYSATDPSGVGYTAVLKDGIRDEERFSEYPHAAGQSTSFETGAKETLLDNFLGTAVQVRARDRHGNEETVVAFERSNFWGQVAVELGAEYADPQTARQLGTLSGFTVGAGESAETLDAVLADPLGFLDSLQQLVAVLDNLGVLEKLIRMLPAAIREKQELNNPYDPETQPELYESYRSAWYAGYGSYFVVSMVAGQQATKAVKSTKTFQRVADSVSTTRVGRIGCGGCSDGLTRVVECRSPIGAVGTSSTGWTWMSRRW